MMMAYRATATATPVAVLERSEEAEEDMEVQWLLQGCRMPVVESSCHSQLRYCRICS